MNDKAKNQDAPETPQVDTAEVNDDDLDNVSGGLPNGAMTTQNGQGTSYSGLS